MKRIICMAVCLALIATMAISGSVAYLYDQDDNVNVFSVGSVDIVQYEEERTDSGLQDFTQKDMKYPMVESGSESNPTENIHGNNVTLRDPEYYRNYVDKIVTVENKGASEAYVRNIVAIPTGNADVNWLEVDWFDFGSETSSDWTLVDPITENVDIDGVPYDIYVFNYSNAADGGKLQPKDFTLPTLLGFGLSKNVGYDDEKQQYFYQETFDSGDRTYIDIDPSEMKIYVATQAVQTYGFDDFDHAFRETFGTVSGDNHPWNHLSSGYGVVNGETLSWEQMLNAEPALVTMHPTDSEALWSFDPSITKLVINSNDVKKIWTGSTDKANSKLETLIIGNGVEEIGGLAFDGCASLKTVELPSTPIKIKGNAFSETSIESINIPGSATFEGTLQFKSCKSLTTVTLGEGITSIPQTCFYGCSALKEVNLPSTLETIGTQSFGFCEGLESITLPTSLKTIESSAFTWCENLSSIGPFTNVTSIGNFAFKNCYALKEVYLPESLRTTVEANKASIFDGCKNITIKYAS